MSEQVGEVNRTFCEDDSGTHERCRALINAVGDGIVTVDADGELAFANERAVEILGRSSDELTEFSYDDSRLDPADEDGNPLETGTFPFDRVREQGEPLSNRIMGIRRPTGGRVWLSVNGAPQWSEDDAFDGAVFTFEEITDQRDAESELEEIHGRVTDGFYALDENFRFTHVNERAEEMIDFDDTGLVGEHVWETFEWAATSKIQEEYERAMETQEATSFEVLYPDPLDAWYEINAYPSSTGLSVYFQDITERKERESERERMMGEVRDSEERLQLALEAGEMGTWELDLQTEESAVRSPQHDRVFGYESPVEEWGLEIFLDHVHPDDRADVRQRFEDAYETGSWEFECRIHRVDGEQRWITAQGEFDFDDDGTPIRAVGVVQDITERKEREQALEESERRYRTLAEYFPNGLVTLFDHGLEYTLAAGQGFDRIPVDPDDLEGHQFHDVWPDETVAELEPALQSTLDGEEARIELEYAGREWVLHAVPITDEQGNVFAGMTMAQDITEQKNREQYLEEAKTQLEAATEAGAVGTWEWHIPEDQFVTGVSFANTFGVDPEAAREGVPIDRFLSSIHEDDRDRVAEQIDETIEHCDEFVSEYRVWNADDDLRWVVARGQVECDEAGDAVRFPGAITDITERKRAELEAEKQSRQLETLFRVLPVGVVVANGDGSLRRANETAQEIWGGDVFDSESVGEYEKFSAVWADSGEPVGPKDWTMYQVVQGEEVTEPNIFEIETFDGQRRIIMEHGKPVRDEDGNVSRAVVTLTDITERRESQRKLEETVAKLEASNERLEQFAYAASHDLQEPLRMITSYLQLLEDRYGDSFDEDGQEFLEFAVDGAERMREMINGLLAYSRVDTQGGAFEPVDLNAVLDNVREDLQMRIEESDAEITSEELPRVNGDDSQLRQLFQNLLENAIEYSGDEPPQIDISVERDGRDWVFAVRDEGVGIDSTDTDRIFEVFQRLYTNEEHSGTGIGLALCRRIVERHGGEIWAESTPGEETTFVFTIPVDS
ncbi:PAS domain S-box-containing protein [Natronorubrum sediminis]|uniref:histidine kinase n=1 Tax=Natronorubrum sediminis TaxID=640943 RepID=A0A1H6G0X6_9EURY|nr:PAS domain S-box protein [Natronorubrum sediminis]SEH16262.1 PAS domain S-box-containing protein [Natronorubrum sediminis]